MKSRRPRAWNSTLPAPTSRMKRSELERARKPKRKSAAQRRRDAERKAAEFARKYGSEERVLFVKFALRCAVDGCYLRPENAHLDGEGIGRKGHYTRIAPLCHRHHSQLDHELGSVRAFDRHHTTDLEAEAEAVERDWQTWGKGWIAARKADGSYETMRRAA